ncbi:MAG: hypothetical protein AAGL98_05035, partial [Planctomycetota bacterium]
MPEPIRQEIETTFDPAGVERAIDTTREMAEEVQLAAERAQLAARSSRDQEAALAQLVREQQTYEQRVEAGETVDEQAELRARERAEAIAGLASQLRGQRQAEARAAEAVAQLTQAGNQAEAADQTRMQGLAETKRELGELVRTQDRYEREIREGAAATAATEQAEQERVQQIDRLGRELAEERRIQERVTAAVRRHEAAQDQAAVSGNRYGDVIDTMSGRMAAFVLSIVGTGGAVRALQVMGEELDRRIEQTREFAEAQLNLQFLGSTFNEQEREFLGRAAEAGGRSPVEVARAYTSLRSRFSDRSDAELQELFLEITETGITTDAGLEELTEAFAGLFAENNDSGRSQNILRESITQAGVGDPAVLARLFGKFLGPGQQLGNISEAESAGLVAASTALDTRAPEEQATGLRTVLLALLGNRSDQQQEIVDRAGIDTTNLLTVLDTLGQAQE